MACERVQFRFNFTTMEIKRSFKISWRGKKCLLCFFLSPNCFSEMRGRLFDVGRLPSPSINEGKDYWTLMDRKLLFWYKRRKHTTTISLMVIVLNRRQAGPEIRPPATCSKFSKAKTSFLRHTRLELQTRRRGVVLDGRQGRSHEFFALQEFFGRTTVIIKIKCETHDMYTQILMKKKLN